jgi:hypothetical protein
VPAKATPVDNIVAVFHEVQASGLAGARGEFETTAQYEARLAAWKRKGAARKYVFLVENNGQLDSFTYTLEYNADTESMHLIVGEYDTDTVQLRTIRTVLGTYVGVNAFGVKKLITRMMEETYHLKLSESSPLHLTIEGRHGETAPAEYVWHMEPAAARTN